MNVDASTTWQLRDRSQQAASRVFDQLRHMIVSLTLAPGTALSRSALQKEFGPRGFSVLGFPCNQFGSQEPGDASQIEQFCTTNYAITFPMFAKIDVNGNDAHPLYQYLKNAKSGLLGSSIKWNFTKFLIDRSGRVAARHAPTATPKALKKEIEALL